LSERLDADGTPSPKHGAASAARASFLGKIHDSPVGARGRPLDAGGDRGDVVDQVRAVLAFTGARARRVTVEATEALQQQPDDADRPDGARRGTARAFRKGCLLRWAMQ